MSNHVDDFRLAADSASGQCPGDNLGQGSKVRVDAVSHLSAPGGCAESGYDFVEYQHYAMLSGEFTQSLQIVGRVEGQLTVVGAGGFQNQSGDVGIFVQGVFHCVQVTGRHDNHAPPTSCGNARRSAIGASHRVIVPPVEVVL